MAHKEHKVTHGHSDTGDVQVADRGKKAKCGVTWSPRAWDQVRALSRDRSLVTPTQLPGRRDALPPSCFRDYRRVKRCVFGGAHLPAARTRIKTFLL